MSGQVASAQLFDPKTNSFELGAGVCSLPAPRDDAATAPLSTGQVLIAGGAGPGLDAKSALLFGVPDNFTVTVKGRKLIVTVAASGTVSVAPPSGAPASGASEAKKSKGLQRPSQGSGGPGQIKVKLKLTKGAASKLARKGKLKFRAAITFSPDAGIPRTETLKLRVKLKLKRH